MYNINAITITKLRNAASDIGGEARRIMDLLEKIDSEQDANASTDSQDNGASPRPSTSPFPPSVHQTLNESSPAANSASPNALSLGKTSDGLTRRPLAWGKRVSIEFCDRVLWIESDLGLNADNLMACMAFETGERFSASVRNPASTATGLIQFMEATARRLGTTTSDLAKMTAENQLNYVWRYFNDYAERMDLRKWDLADTYMAILWPSAIGKPDSHPVFVQGRGPAYAVNRGLDVNRDGTVTKRECASKVIAKMVEGLKPENVGYGNLAKR